MNKNFMKQAQQLQARLQQAQKELEESTMEGSAGGGVVKAVLNGKQMLESIEIAPEAAEDVELLQDLVVAAVNDASQKMQEKAAQTMGSVTGGMKLPGLM